MRKQLALQVVMVISIIGILFSGFLSYEELFAGSCNLGFVTCGAKIGSLPACVYGLVMYLTVFIVAFLGDRSSK